MKLDSIFFHRFESVLPCAITIMNRFWRYFKQFGIVQNQFFREERFPASGRSNDQNAAGRMKSKRFSPFHLEKMTRVTFMQSLFIDKLGHIHVYNVSILNHPRSNVLTCAQLCDHWQHNHAWKTYSRNLAKNDHGLLFSNKIKHNVHRFDLEGLEGLVHWSPRISNDD